MFSIRQCLIFLALSILFFGCKTDISGDPSANLAPETFLVVDSISRTGPDRLSTRVEMSWWADDQDGYIDGFEVSIGATPMAWTFTKATDSVFLLPTPAGTDSSDFRLWVRAYDNEGLSDPTPATLLIPVKNAKPQVSFTYGVIEPTESFPVLKYSWEAFDPDGEANLANFEFVWNDTNRSPYQLEIGTNSATFSALSLTNDSSDCKVFRNNNLTEESAFISGLQLNKSNTLYVRVRDLSGATSSWDSSRAVYVKKVNSSILLLNAYSSPGAIASAESYYASRLVNQGLGIFDTLEIFRSAGGELQEQSRDNLTQSRIFDLFSTIIWFGNNAENSLSLAQRTSANFFDLGGKMYMSVYVSSSFDELSSFLDFTPASALVLPDDTTLILDSDSSLNPNISGWPILESTGIVGIVRPIIPDPGVQILYSADLIARDAMAMLNPWLGNSAVVAKKEDLSGNTNFIFSTLELHKMDGNANADLLFNKILIDEFGL